MYTIGFMNVDGAVYTANEVTPVDVVFFAAQVEADNSLRGIGVQCDTVDEFAALWKLTEPRRIFRSEGNKARFAWISDAPVEYGCTEMGVQAAFIGVVNERIEGR